MKVADREFSGALISLLGVLEDFIRYNIVQERTIYKDQSGFQETTVYKYPLVAFREFLMNAIMHRDYESNAPIYLYEFSDRLEIINPGGLYRNARPDNFPRVSDYRNPILATAMKNLGYVNRFNYGVVSSQKALKNNGNPEAKFDLDRQAAFSVTIYNHKDWNA